MRLSIQYHRLARASLDAEVEAVTSWEVVSFWCALFGRRYRFTTTNQFKLCHYRNVVRRNMRMRKSHDTRVF